MWIPNNRLSLIRSAFVLLALALAPASVVAQARPTLSAMTKESFSKALTGSLWQGEKDGKIGHAWFATPGSMIWRWEVNPGVWDSRTVSIQIEDKGRVHWRWTADTALSTKLNFSENLQSILLDDVMLGGWTLRPAGRKVLEAKGGRLDTMNRADFTTWLSTQTVKWRSEKLEFRKGGICVESMSPDIDGRYVVVSPGIVEAYVRKSNSEVRLLQFSPNLESATLNAWWGVNAVRLKSAPASTPLASPVIIEPDAPQTSLVAMDKAKFSKWLVGTEWEFTNNGVWHLWFCTDSFVTQRGPDSHVGFGYEVTAPGQIKWHYRAQKDPSNINQLHFDNGLATGELHWNENKERASVRLIGHRLPFYMDAPSAKRVAEMLPDSRINMGSGDFITIPSPDKAFWNHNGGLSKLNLSIAGPGMFQFAWPDNPSDAGLFVLRTTKKLRLHWIWGASDPMLEAISNPAAEDSSNDEFFNAVLGQSPSIELKKNVATINALLVTTLGDDREAGAMAKISLTAIPIQKDTPATLVFNQTVGPQMNKSLREVARFQTIHHRGWPRGSNMELSFADKYSGKDGPSAAVACALLLESALTGMNIDPNFAVTGDMNADGSVQPVGGIAAKLRGATKGGGAYLALPEKNSTDVMDLAITSGAVPFLDLQIFTISSFPEASRLAANDDSTLKNCLEIFALLAQRLKAQPMSLSTPTAISSLQAILKEMPNHASARCLLAIAEGKLPASLSPRGSLGAINLALEDTMESGAKALLSKSSLDRGKVAGLRRQLQKIRPKVDKRTHGLVDAWIDWSSLVDQISQQKLANRKIENDSLNTLKALAARITVEEAALNGNSDFREDLMR